MSTAVVARKPPPKVPKPTWHAPWELSAVISGHLGWVRSIAFDPSNEWFATGSSDRTIKVVSGLKSTNIHPSHFYIILFILLILRFGI